MKKIIADSSSLISISENCLMPLINQLQGKVQIIIPPAVKFEIIDYPLTTHKFGLNAARMNSFVDKDTLTVYTSKQLISESKRISDIANSLLEYKHHYIKVFQEGEAQSIACLRELNEDTLLIDERTTRLLIENPIQLKDYMEQRTSYKLEINPVALDHIYEEFKGINIIRSAELVAYAYKKGFFKFIDSPKTLENALYALRFAGCSITDQEIADYVEMLG